MILTNGRIITHDKENPYIENGAVVINEEKIVDLGEVGEILKKYPNKKVMDVEGKVIMPGIINTHHHIYSAFARGMASKGEAPKNFMDILEGLW